MVFVKLFTTILANTEGYPAKEDEDRMLHGPKVARQPKPTTDTWNFPSTVSMYDH